MVQNQGSAECERSGERSGAEWGRTQANDSAPWKYPHFNPLENALGPIFTPLFATQIICTVLAPARIASSRCCLKCQQKQCVRAINSPRLGVIYFSFMRLPGSDPNPPATVSAGSPCTDAFAQVLPLEQLHGDEVPPSGLVDVVADADVRMIQDTCLYWMPKCSADSAKTLSAVINTRPEEKAAAR